ncbi:MAG: TolC family protein [Rikenellaceae bacterium]
MNKINKLVALLLLPLCCAAHPQIITLEQCRTMAIESNMTLKSADERRAASEDMLRAYKSNNLPNISASGGYLYSTMSFSESITGGYLPTFSLDPNTGGLTPNIAGYAADGSPIFSSYAYMPDMLFDLELGSVWSAGLKATQPIYMGGKVSTATALAQLGVDAANIERARTEAEVVLSADEAFYTYLKVEEIVLAADAYRTTVDEFMRQAQQMFDNGMCTKNDLMKVQIKANESELQQLKARNGLILAHMNLCHVVGLPLSTLDIKVVDEFDMLQNIESTLDVSARPEYELLAKSVEAKELEVKLAQSDFRPSVSAIASYSYTNGVTLNSETLFGSSPSFTGGVMVNIPIVHWGEGRRKVSAARREVTVAENTQAELVEKMTLELMQSINAYNEAQAEVILMERSVAQAEENLRQSERLCEVGMESISSWLEAQAMWQKAMSDLVESKANQRLAYARYCRSSGQL